MKRNEFSVPGFFFSGVSVGIKQVGKRDFGLIYSETPCSVAGLFTTNAVKAAPVRLDLERLKGGMAQAVVVNSGNANACTGARGLKDARRIAARVAKELKVDETLVFVSSTGVIGVPLPVKKMEGAVPDLVRALSPEGWMDTVEAIMTTDTFPKVEVSSCRIEGRAVKLAGMVKGAGMIRPNLATMLSFLVTDAHIDSALLQQMLKEAAEGSYQRVTVDGETSTNDTVLLLANGKAAHRCLSRMDRDARIFQEMLSEQCAHLAKSLVKDGEGATKFIEIVVEGARDGEDARRAAYAVAHSPLVKTAFFGEDANWGRILCALGHSGARIDPERIDVSFDRMAIVRNGTGVGGRREMAASRVLKKKSFTVTIDLHQGKGRCSLFTTDLSLDYVKINASYRS